MASQLEDSVMNGVDPRSAPVARRRSGSDENELGLRRLLELSCDWYWTLDSQWRLVQLDGRRAEAGANLLQGQLGKAPWDWSGVIVDSDEFARLRTALLAHEPFHELEFSQRDANGHLRYLAVWGEPLFDGQDRFIGYRGTARDLTRRKRADALVALEHAVTRSLAEASTSRKILQAVMRVICESEQWETAGYFQVEDDHGTTRLIAGWSGPGMSTTAAEYYKQTSDRVIPSGGMLSRVVASGESLWVAALKESQTTWAQRVSHTGERATFFCPVLVDARVIGVFAFASREIREPDERLLQSMRVIGEQVGQFLKRKQAEQVLRESEARFRALTELSSDWYWEIDANFRLTRIEGRHLATDDYLSGERAIGKTRWDAGLQIEGAGGWSAHQAQLQAQLPFRDVVMMHDDEHGRRRYISVSGEPMLDHRGAFVGYRGVGRDITGRKLAENRIQHLATHDGLTGLPNRVLFSELLQMAIRSAERYRWKFAVLFIDLDRFKIINDTLGHEAGDLLLKEMARRLKSCLRASDVIARMGGDEFVVLVQQVERPDDAVATARKLLTAAARPVLLHGSEYRISASIGISLYGVHAVDEQSLMQTADVAMYAAKQSGKNDVQIYSAESAFESKSRLTLETQLRGALERNEFFLHYQAKVDSQTNAIVGVEALLRWHNDELGSVSPIQFISIAEETGLILPIGKWVLRQACLQCVKWQRDGLPPLTMSVNLSARQFSDEFLLGDIAGVLHETGMRPELLELELTEGTVIRNVERAIKMLNALKGMGVRLAIDDFGTGYSSLGQLKTLPIDTLKVDRSFIRDISTSAEDKAITQAIIAIGKTLSLTVVAEGVETQAQEAFLRTHRCDQMQGYRFSKPIGAAEFVELWQQHASAGWLLPDS